MNRNFISKKVELNSKVAALLQSIARQQTHYCAVIQAELGNARQTSDSWALRVDLAHFI